MSHVGFSVLRIYRLPEHFGANELRSYLEQFGKVYDMKFPVSKKTLKGKGYAFVKMSDDIAPIVVSTLDNVLLFNKIIKCEVLSDPNWRSFRRQRSRKLSSQTFERNRQTVAALKRVNECLVNSESDSLKNVLPKSVRRRKRTIEKRLSKIEGKNSNFKFITSSELNTE